MTEDRALKQAIRRRMELTGEKYTEARRALAGDPGDKPGYPWAYAPYWEEIAERYERIRGEHDEALARATVYATMLSLQLTFTLSPFYKIAVGRAPSGPDGWLAERPAVEWNARTIEAAAPLAAVGFAPELERNRQIADRVVVLIDTWSAGASPQAREAAKRRRASLAAMPAPREPSSRAAAGAWGERSQEIDHEVYGDDRDTFLRHPRVDKIYRSRRGTDDAVLLEQLDAWLEDLQRNYAELVDAMPPPWHEHGELDFEASSEDPHTSAAQRDFYSPERMRVDQAHRGDLGDYELVATHLLRVEEGVSPQPDGIAVVAPGERWHIRGHRLADGTIMPCTGTYRISSPDSHTRPQSRAGSASKPAPAAAPRSGRVKHAVADDVRAAHVAAATEADRLGHHGYLGCEHLLLGLLSDDDSIATRVLAKHGVHLEAARREVNRMIGEPSDTGATTHTGRTMTPRANNVGVLAQIEAERLGAPMPNTAHYLLALLTEGDSVAVRVLEALGANLRELRSDLLSAMQVPRETSQRYIHERDTYLTSS